MRKLIRAKADASRSGHLESEAHCGSTLGFVGKEISGPSTPTEPEALLERSDQLTVLTDALDAVIAGSVGRLVLIGGEAGVGKTALLREFCDSKATTARVLWGTCEPLLTPAEPAIKRQVFASFDLQIAYDKAQRRLSVRRSERRIGPPLCLSLPR